MNRKNIFRSLLLGCLVAPACAVAQSYTIKGNVQGLNNDSLVLVSRYYATGGEVVDTLFTKASNNQFTLTGQTKHPVIVYAAAGGLKSRKNFSFILEPGTIEIQGTLDSAESIRATGTPDNDAYTAHKQQENAVYAKIRALYASLKVPGLSRADTTAIEKEAAGLRGKINEDRKRFIQAHPNSQASGIYLYVMQDHLPVPELERVYQSLGTDVKNSTYGYIVATRLVAKKRTLVGMEAPAFDITDQAGKKISLADYKGKYVLLDFWASWCVPCRAETPWLTAAYKKYKDKGFTILSVSLDDNRKKWEDAIVKDEMVWANASELKAFNEPVAKLYGVQPIPDNFLIDPNGKIIARGLRGEELVTHLSGILK